MTHPTHQLNLVPSSSRLASAADMDDDLHRRRRLPVTNAATGSVLTEKKCTTGRSSARLQVVRAHNADNACSTWTLVPGNDGTWSLANAGSSQTVRLLIP